MGAWSWAKLNEVGMIDGELDISLLTRLCELRQIINLSDLQFLREVDKKVPTLLVTCKLNVVMHVKHEARNVAHTQQMLGTRTAVDQKKLRRQKGLNSRRQKGLNSRGQNIRTKEGRISRGCGGEKMDFIFC